MHPYNKIGNAMNRFARSDNCGHALVAGFGFATLFWALALSASPQLHERVHADANRIEHSCAVTLIASGSYEHAAHPELVSVPRPTIEFSKNNAVNSVWVQSLFLCAHVFAHAPPAHS
jgi:hypothetical protein